MSEPGGPPFAGWSDGPPSLFGDCGSEVEGFAGSKSPPGVGITITREMLSIKSPGIGILPKYIDLIVGRKARILINADHPVTWDAI